MTAFIKNRPPILWVFVLMTMLVLTWLFPSSRLIIEATFLLVSLAMASLVAVAKNREAYQQGKLTRGDFIRTNIFDFISILLAMTSAGLLAKSIAPIIMAQVGNNLLSVGVLIVISLLIGIGIGILMKRIRGYLLTSSPAYKFTERN